MIQSPQHETAKWLAELLQPVLSKLSKFVVKDSFELNDTIRNCSMPESGHMCSFDIESLFMNVPLEDTIRIAADELYHSDILPPCLTEASFTKLLRKVTSGVEFSFDEVMYRQTDGVAMGSPWPLGPVLANICAGFHEEQLALEDNTDVLLYRRFVDDTFSLNTSMEQSEKLLSTLNKLHPALEFTCEHEQN